MMRLRPYQYHLSQIITLWITRKNLFHSLFCRLNGMKGRDWRAVKNLFSSMVQLIMDFKRFINRLPHGDLIFLVQSQRYRCFPKRMCGLHFRSLERALRIPLEPSWSQCTAFMLWRGIQIHLANLCGIY